MKEKLHFVKGAKSVAEFLGITEERAIKVKNIIYNSMQNDKFKTKIECLDYLWAEAKNPTEAVFMLELFGETYAAVEIKESIKRTIKDSSIE